MKVVCHWSKGFFVCMTVFIGLIMSVSPLFGGGLKAVYSADELTRMIEYNNRMVSHLDEQMASIQGDMDWLDLKIKRMIDYRRVVPSEMTLSMKNKANLLVSISKEKARLESLVASYGGKLPGTGLAGSFNQITVADLSASEDIDPGSRDGNVPGNFTGSKQLYEELINEVQKAGIHDWVEVVSSGSSIRIENRLPILFATGHAGVVKEYRDFLKKFAVLIKPYDVRIIVDGYTDSSPIHNKKYPSNLELGATRAANIVHELVRSGVKPSAFKIATTGEYRLHGKKAMKQKLIERRAQVSVVFSG